MLYVLLFPKNFLKRVLYRGRYILNIAIPIRIPTIQGIFRSIEILKGTPLRNICHIAMPYMIETTVKIVKITRIFKEGFAKATAHSSIKLLFHSGFVFLINPIKTCSIMFFLLFFVKTTPPLSK